MPHCIEVVAEVGVRTGQPMNYRCLLYCVHVSERAASAVCVLVLVLCCWTETERFSSKGEAKIRAICPHVNNLSSWECHKRYVER